MTQFFRDAMALMRSQDPQRQEDGFDQLLPHAAAHLDDLITEFDQERDDLGLRCWLLELISAAKSPTALPFLRVQLDGPNEALRLRAANGLSELDTPEARTLLWEARAQGLVT